MAWFNHAQVANAVTAPAPISVPTAPNAAGQSPGINGASAAAAGVPAAGTNGAGAPANSAASANGNTTMAAGTAANGYTGIDNGAPLTSVDTDADGLTDDFEKLAGTNPLAADSDADGLTDGFEGLKSHTDPLSADTDKDGIGDAVEVAAGSDAGQIPGIAGVSGLG